MGAPGILSLLLTLGPSAPSSHTKSASDFLALLFLLAVGKSSLVIFRCCRSSEAKVRFRIVPIGSVVSPAYPFLFTHGGLSAAGRMTRSQCRHPCKGYLTQAKCADESSRRKHRSFIENDGPSHLPLKIQRDSLASLGRRPPKP